MLPNLGLYKYILYYYQKWAAKLCHLYKSPNSFTLWAKPKKPNKTLLQSPLLHGTLTKSIATQHSYKACCYTVIFFTKSQNIIKKPKCYFGNYLQKTQTLFWQLFTKSPNTILATFYKSPILFWQLFTKSLNTILAHSIKKTQNYWANNYSTKAQIIFAKELYYAQRPKLFIGKNIF